jgi:hypothetical protein
LSPKKWGHFIGDKPYPFLKMNTSFRTFLSLSQNQLADLGTRKFPFSLNMLFDGKNKSGESRLGG